MNGPNMSTLCGMRIKSLRLHTIWSIAGMTTTCEIILSMKYTSKPYYVYYFNPERNTLRSIEIQGFEECDKVGGVFAFVDYLEDLNVNDTKQLKSSLLHQGLTKYH